MGRFVGKIAVGGRLLDEAVGGTIHPNQPGAAAFSSGRVALPRAAERLARSADVPIHLITEGGLTLRVSLGQAEAVGELYLACDFDGRVEELSTHTTFSILAYPDLRNAARRPAPAPVGEDDAVVVLTFVQPTRDSRPVCSEG